MNEQIIWEPNPGSQHLFVTCPFDEALIHGTRGSAKTDGLLFSYASQVGKFGNSWRGILFRKTYKELEDIIFKSQKWFSQVFPKAKFNSSDHSWTFPDGEQLFFRYMERKDDYWHYHGHEYPWIGWEELTSWPTDDCYSMMMSCRRSASLPKGVPRMVRGTTNPWGPGHSWVKARFIDRGPPGRPIRSTIRLPTNGEEFTVTRVHLFAHYMENPHLSENDPAYIAELKSIKDPNLKKAWDEGSWDIVAGGFFTEVFKGAKHVVSNFTPPSHWRWFPSFDWGCASPHSLGLWCVSEGDEVIADDGNVLSFPRGAKIKFDEWYGTIDAGSNKGLSLSNDDLALGVWEKIRDWRDKIGRVNALGCADPSMFKEDGGPSINAQMEKAIGKIKLWYKADNTRVPGWQAMVNALAGGDHGPMLYMTQRCEHLIRTIVLAPRDVKKLDDVDTDCEDHALDETRYAVMWKERKIEMKKLTGF